MTAEDANADHAIAPPPVLRRVDDPAAVARPPTGGRPRPGLGRLTTRLFSRRAVRPERPADRPTAAPLDGPPAGVAAAEAAADTTLSDQWFDDLLEHLERATGDLRTARYRTADETLH